MARKQSGRSGKSGRSGWARYRADADLRDEDGNLLAPTESSAQPSAASSADRTDDAGDDSGDTSHDAPLPMGCFVVLGIFVLIVALVWVLTAVRGGDIPLVDDDVVEVDPARIAPLDAADVQARFDQAGRVSELRGLPASHLNVGPTSIRIDFYDAETDESRDFSKYDGVGGYELTIEANPFDFIDDLLYDLDEVSPEVLAQVSEDAVAEVDDPEYYSVIVRRDLRTEELGITVVVSDTRERSWLIDADLDGTILDKTEASG